MESRYIERDGVKYYANGHTKGIVHTNSDASNVVLETKLNNLDSSFSTLQNTFTAEIQNLTVADPSSAEIVAARGGKATLGAKITDIDSQLAENVKHKLDWVNVIEMGADNTGSIDCSALVQSLLNTYSTVYFPKGNYRLNNGLIVNGNKTILGEGSRRDIADNLLGGTFLYFYNASGYAIQSVDGAKNITLKNFCMLGNYNGGGGIRLFMANPTDAFHKLIHLKVVNFSLDNIMLENTIEPLLFDVQSLGSYQCGLNSSSSGVKITNSQFYANYQHGIKFSKGGALVTGTKIFANGQSGITYAGIYLTNSAFCVQVTGCSIHENYYSGIVLDGAGVVNNTFSAIDFAGNNKAKGTGCDIVLDGSGNIFNGCTAINAKHSDNVYASLYAVVSVAQGAKNNRIDITTSRALLIDTVIFQFLAAGMANRKMVYNPSANTLNSVVIDGVEYCIGNIIPKTSGFTNAGFTNYYNMYQVCGVTTYSLSNDILTVSLPANDTLPVPTTVFDISALGQTGIKFTMVGDFGGAVKNAFIEFEIKIGSYDSTLGLCIDGYFKYNTSVMKYFMNGYNKLGVYTASEWTKIRIPVNFDNLTVSVSEFNLVILFIANTLGSTAARTGNSFQIKNLKIATA